MGCPVGLLVTQRLLRLYHDRFEPDGMVRKNEFDLEREV